MNKMVDSFLNEVCSHVDCKEIHEDIRAELTEHIEDLKEENLSSDCDERKALEMAISTMGNAEEIGVKLNSQHKPQTEWSILILTLLISSVGAAIILLSDRSAGNNIISFSRYIAYLLVGVVSMFSLYNFDYTRLKKLSFLSYFSGVLLLIITIFSGIQVNGARRWLSFGGISVSVPELATVLFLIGFVGFLEKYRGRSFFNTLKLFFYGIVSVFLMMLLPDLASALILALSYSITILIAVLRNHFTGNKKVQLLTLLGSGIAAIIVCILNILSSPYKIDRVAHFFFRNRSGGENYFQHMADIWLSLSKLIGKAEGTYQGYTLNSSLPNIFSEYILVNIIATLGWIAGIILVGTIFIFIIRMFLTTRKVKNIYGFYLALSMCAVLSMQFIINILMNFNMFPLIGVNMPFVSYDSTAYVMNMTSIGIILSVWRRDNMMPAIRNSMKISLKASSGKNLINYLDGKIIIDLKAWKI